MPKIAIDISPTVNGNAKRGVGFYTSRLLTALQSEIAINPKYADFQISLIENCQSADLIHYPFFDLFSPTLPLTQKPFVVTVHDLIPLQFKKNYPVGIRGHLNNFIQMRRLKSARQIITDSLSSQKAIEKLANYPLARIHPIYLAADPIYTPITDKEKITSIKAKYKLPPKFILYVGDVNWNKNIPRLVSVCQQLNYHLVIVGSTAVQPNVIAHPWNRDLIWLQSQSSDLIHRLGFVDSADLAVIYSLALAYCQPSYAEGFGLSVVEAMSCGCPIVYANNSSLREICRGFGQPFMADSTPSLVRALKKVSDQSRYRLKLKKLSLKRAVDFNWTQTAQKTLEVYRLAI